MENTSSNGKPVWSQYQSPLNKARVERKTKTEGKTFVGLKSKLLLGFGSVQFLHGAV
jgi:hypothetical protein